MNKLVYVSIKSQQQECKDRICGALHTLSNCTTDDGGTSSAKCLGTIIACQSHVGSNTLLWVERSSTKRGKMKTNGQSTAPYGGHFRVSVRCSRRLRLRHVHAHAMQSGQSCGVMWFPFSVHQSQNKFETCPPHNYIGHMIRIYNEFQAETPIERTSLA